MLTGPELEPDGLDVPAGVAVREYVPHGAVLGDSSLVLSHGGMGTLMASLTAGVPSLIFGSDHLGGWHESLVETALILVVAIPVVVLTRRLVTRLHYLEEFLRLCAWCRKLHMDNDWIPFEEFLQRRFDTRTSHGICPACRAEQRKAAGARRAS